METSNQSNAAPMTNWTEREQNAWALIREGQIAQMGRQGEIASSPTQTWTVNQQLSPRFIRDLLTNPRLREQIPVEGIQVVGAWFPEDLDLACIPIAVDLVLERCRFDKNVNLNRIRTSRTVSLSGSFVRSLLSMQTIHVEDYLLISNASINQITLPNAWVGKQFVLDHNQVKVPVLDGMSVGGLMKLEHTKVGQVRFCDFQIGTQFIVKNADFADPVNMGSSKSLGSTFISDSNFRRDLNMNHFSCGGELEIFDAKFKNSTMALSNVNGSIHFIKSSFAGDIKFNDSRIGRDIYLGGSHFRNLVSFNSADIGGSLSTKCDQATLKAKMNALEMIHGSVGEQITFEDSVFDGRLHMETINVGQDFFLRGGEFRLWVDLFFLNVADNFEVAGAELGRLDLSGCRIGGELRLGSKHHDPVEWRGDKTLILRNVHADTIQDTVESWPENLVLQGFSYNRLGGFLGLDETSDIATRDTGWFVQWFERDSLFTPQPYEQIAKILRQSGQRTKADDILFACRERERKESDGRRRLWLTAMKLFIGYGFRTYYSLWWILGLTAIGTVLLWVFNQPTDASLADRAVYTLDTLLPVIQLDKAHESVNLEGAIRFYFYFLKAMGFVLGSFIVAGLSGLTKRDGS